LAILLPIPSQSASRAGERAKLYFKYAFLPHLWDGAKNTFTDPKALMALAAGGAMAAVAHQYDGQVDDYWKDHQMDYGLADIGNAWGDTYPTVIIALGLMGTGYGLDNERLAGAGEALGEAALISGAVTTAIKYLAQKERPHAGDNLSFPSGHATVAFCTAAVLHHRFGWTVGATAYTLAIITGLARMDVEAHWVSDVVMGATIGMVTGYAVSIARDDYPYQVRWGSSRPLIFPTVATDRAGLNLAWTW
jgi:hypothetical protein